jgi:hypothetical protein
LTLEEWESQVTKPTVTTLCRCCELHYDDLVPETRICLDCGAPCQCRGCQVDSRAKLGY